MDQTRVSEQTTRPVRTLKQRVTPWLSKHSQLIIVILVGCVIGVLICLLIMFFYTGNVIGGMYSALATLGAALVAFIGWVLKTDRDQIAANEHIVNRAQFFHNIYDRMFVVDQMLINYPQLLRAGARPVEHLVRSSIPAETTGPVVEQPNCTTYTLFTEVDGQPLSDDLVRLKALVWHMLNFFDELFMLFEPHHEAGHTTEELAALRGMAKQFDWSEWQEYIKRRTSSPVFLEVFCEDEDVFGKGLGNFIHTKLGGDIYERARMGVDKSKEQNLRRLTF